MRNDFEHDSYASVDLNASQPDSDPLAPAKGIMLGLLLGSAMWVLIIAGCFWL